MKQIVKKNICISLIVLMLLTTSCESNQRSELELKNDTYFDFITKEEIVQRGHIAQLPEYQKENVIAFKNKNGTKTFYVFSSPIFFLDKKENLKMIDTRIQELSNDSFYGFSTKESDIESHYPRELSKDMALELEKDFKWTITFDTDCFSEGKRIIGTNYIGEQKEMIEYDDVCLEGTTMRLYPSSVGTNCEVRLKETPVKNTFSAWIKFSEGYIALEKTAGGYLVAIDQRIPQNALNILAVVQPPILKDSNDNISINNEVNIIRFDEKKGYNVEFTLDKEYLSRNSSFFLAFEMRREKQPDNAVYSKRPNLSQAFLTNYCILGCSKEFGIGRLMLRYNFVKELNISSENIKNVQYDIYHWKSQERDTAYEMRKILGDWCSVNGNWNSNYKIGGSVALQKSCENIISFDITNEIKRWIDNGDTEILEQRGLLLAASNEREEGSEIFLTNDNTLFRNKTIITINDE